MNNINRILPSRTLSIFDDRTRFVIFFRSFIKTRTFGFFFTFQWFISIAIGIIEMILRTDTTYEQRKKAQSIFFDLPLHVLPAKHCCRQIEFNSFSSSLSEQDFKHDDGHSS